MKQLNGKQLLLKPPRFMPVADPFL
jgi:hypothetical protein